MSAHQIVPGIALVGSPNSGKTTLFNWLTGSKFKTVNYAGSTVDCYRGFTLGVYGTPPLKVIDTPGIYSLQPHGRDEEITTEILNHTDEVKAAIVVIDGTQMNRQLYLVRQIQELGLPMVIAVTMMDLVRASGRKLELQKLAELLDAPVIGVDGLLGGGVADVVTAARLVASTIPVRKAMVIDWDDARIEVEVAVAESWARQVVYKVPEQDKLHRLRRWDGILLHPLWGALSFLLIMAGLFSSIFWLAAPLMDLVDTGFSSLAELAFTALGAGEFADFVTNGLISGTGAVLVFVPQIFILFFGFSLLEDTGYLARAATIVDGPLSKIGLSGRAFVPILSGFACAVPAVMAARNIRSVRERWITVCIIPFMTCSARLPVYALLLTFLFTGDAAWKAGLAMTGLYLSAVFVGAIASAILNQVLRREAGGSHFLMELPIYRLPKPGFTLRIAFRRTDSYVRKAGPVIFVFVLLLWSASHFPYHGDLSRTQQLEQSYLGIAGRAMEPIFEPMGLDWRAGVGIMSAFVAREVFVSALAVILSVPDEDQDTLQDSLLDRMRGSTLSSGQPLFTTASVTGLIVFFIIALQCLSTTGITWRETGSWKFAFGQLAAMNILAYVAAVAVVQGLYALGIS